VPELCVVIHNFANFNQSTPSNLPKSVTEQPLGQMELPDIHHQVSFLGALVLVASRLS
jgi:hypothetical protein